MSYLPDRDDSDASEQIFDLPRNTTVNSDIKRWAAKAGVEKNLCYHVSRHTFATLLLTKGADIYTTSKLMGHKSLRTTQIYAEIIDKKKVAAVNLLDDVVKK